MEKETQILWFSDQKSEKKIFLKICNNKCDKVDTFVCVICFEMIDK